MRNPVGPRLVLPTNLMPRINGKKTYKTQSSMTVIPKIPEMSSDTSIVRIVRSKGQIRSSLKTLMDTLVFRNVVTSACRQILGHPSLPSLHS